MADGRIVVELVLADMKARKQASAFGDYMRRQMRQQGIVSGPGLPILGGSPAGIDNTTRSVIKLTSATREQMRAAIELWRWRAKMRTEARVVSGSGMSDFEYSATLPGPGAEPWSSTAGGTGRLYEAWKHQVLRRRLGGGLGRRRFRLDPDWMLRQGADRLMGLGPLDPGTQRYNLMPDWYLSRGASRLMSMGPLSTGSSRRKSLADMLNEFMTKPLTGPQRAMAQVTGALAGLRVGIGLASYAFRMIALPVQMVAKHFSQMAEQARRLYAGALTSGGAPLGFTVRRHLLADVLGVGEREVFQYATQIGYLNRRLTEASRTIAETTRALTTASWAWRTAGWSQRAMRAQFAAEFAPQVTGAARYVGYVTDTLTKFERKTHFGRRMVGALTAAFGLGGADWLLGMMGTRQGAAPQPYPFAYRYPVSQFERQGLVLGIGGGANYQAQTAQNTKKTASLLEKIQMWFATHTTLKPEGYMKPVGAAKP